MPNIEKKLEVLCAVARVLNERRIVWAVGASALLYLKGKADHFNDIDLMVLEQDAGRLREALLSLGTLLPPAPNGQYGTRQFMEFSIDGVDVDVMAGFAIIRDGVVYDCALQPEQICEHMLLGGQHIPLQSLSDWRRYYALMGRPEKVRMIDG